MKIEGKEFRTIWFDEENKVVKIIDQTKLPHQFVIKDLKTVKDAINAIKVMEVRGAPLIGGTAAYGMVLAILENNDLEFIKKSSKELIQARPTAINLEWAVHRMNNALSLVNSNELLNVALKVQSACYGTMSNITFGDKNFGYYETICGGEGASFGNNGADAVHCHMTNTSITDPEILEWYYPVRLTEFSIRKKSGGKGKWFGGNGVIRKIVFLKNLDLTILSNRRIIKPFGMLNRNNAKTGENIIVKKNNRIKLAHACQIKVSKGDTIILKTPGGAGYE